MNTAKRNQLREAICRRLAECFRPPDAEIGAKVEETSDAVCELYPELVKYLPDSSEEATALRADFDRLVAGSGSLSAVPGAPAHRDVPEMLPLIPAEDMLRLCDRADFRSGGSPRSRAHRLRSGVRGVPDAPDDYRPRT